jgi:hypothetical protein
VTRRRWYRTLSIAAGVALAAAIQGCGEGGASSAISATRDSSGIAIVDNTPPINPPTYAALSVEPNLEIGTLDGAEPYQLFRVSDVTQLGDGAIAVGDGGSQQIRVFDAEGRFLRSFGREGEGPGEFKGLGPFRLVAGALHVSDWSLDRVSILGLDGTFERSYPVALPGGDPPMIVDGLADGSWVVTKSFVFRPSNISAVVRDTLPYMLVRAEGTAVDSLGRFPGIEFFVYGNERQTSASSLVFGRMTLATAGADRIAIGPNDRYEVELYGTDGQLERIVRRAHVPRPVTPTDIDAGKAKRLEDAATDNFRRQIEQLYLEMPIPPTMPAFDELRIDALGFLWVRDPLSPVDAVATWHVYGADGRWVGVVTTPTDLGVREIGVDYVLGTWSDELGVEHVRRYALQRDPTGGVD